MQTLKRVKTGFLALGLLLFLQIIVGSPQTFAFSGHGAGTSGSPYRIANCTQLQEINNNLAGYYVLVSDINCNGVSFTNLGTFTGTLDGRNNKITNLNVDDKGLFDNVNNGTVKNIWIVSGSVTGGYIGSFAASSYGNSIFTNVHSGMTLNSISAAYSGGIVGDVNGTTTISKSSFTGSITTNSSYTGGLVGDLWDSGTSISDSFSSGTFNSNASYAGGIAGANFAGTINRVYSNMTYNANSAAYNGGIVGLNQTAINNSFSAVTRTGGTSYGAMIGSNSGTSTNGYFDITTNGTSSCGIGSGCTGVNSGNSTPNYFKNNSTNAPLSSWDFTNVWKTTSGYPTLRSLDDFENPTVPNLGDANGDSTDDAFQPYVGSVSDADGKFSTVTVPSSSGCTLDTPESTATSSLATDTGFSPVVNLTGFTLYCPTAGATVPVTIIYDKLYDTSEAVLRYYNPTTHVYSTVAGATFGTTTVGGVQKTTVTYNLTDGGAYDQDASVNGAIVDPVGISNTPEVPNTGFGPQQPNVLANTLAVVLVGSSAIAVAFIRRSYN